MRGSAARPRFAAFRLQACGDSHAERAVVSDAEGIDDEIAARGGPLLATYATSL